MLGAILVTGFLGGAIAVHLRIGEVGSPPQTICLLLGILTWAGLYLRDDRLRAVLPFMKDVGRDPWIETGFQPAPESGPHSRLG